MIIMAYIKATKAECEAYNQVVTQGENYQGTTTSYDEVKKIKGNFYITKHPNYTTNLKIVNELPKIANDEYLI